MSERSLPAAAPARVIAAIGAAFSIALAIAITPAPAIAAGAQDAARERGEEGLRLFKAERWDAAYAAFAEADRLYHAPTLVLYMARCRQSQGRLLEAAALFDKVAAEPVPPNAPEAFKRAVASARAEGEANRGKIPRVRVVAAASRVLVDGKEISDLAGEIRLDPGAHLFAVEGEGGAAVVKTSLREGESRSIDLALQPGQRLSADGLSLRVVEAPRPSLAPAAIAFGVGGAGVLVGAITGGLALAKIGDAHAGCAQASDGVWHCPPGMKRDNTAAADAARALAPASGVSFAVGGAALAAGVILVLLRDKPAPEGPVSFDISPTWLGVRGRF